MQIDETASDARGSEYLPSAARALEAALSARYPDRSFTVTDRGEGENAEESK